MIHVVHELSVASDFLALDICGLSAAVLSVGLDARYSVLNKVPVSVVLKGSEQDREHS